MYNVQARRSTELAKIINYSRLDKLLQTRMNNVHILDYFVFITLFYVFKTEITNSYNYQGRIRSPSP